MDPTGPKVAGVSRQFRLATERRHTVRHRTHSPAYATLNQSQVDAPDLSEILDISEDGMSIQTSSPLPVERNLSLCLDLSETRARILTTGWVVWSDTSGRAGIRFAQLSAQSRDLLKEWLFVNILTAYDHADAIPTGVSGQKSSSNGLLPSHNIQRDQRVFETAAISGEDSYAPEPQTVRRSVATVARMTGREIAEERDTPGGDTPGGREAEVEPNRFDREITLQGIAERALKITRATGAAIALSDGNPDEMTCVASAGNDAPSFGARLHVGSGFSGECVRTGRSLRCDDSETDDRVDREGCKTLGIRSMVAVPIRPGNKVAGLVEVFSPQPYAFNADDIGALQQLTGSILATIGRAAESPPPPPRVAPTAAVTVAPVAPPPQPRPVKVEKRVEVRPPAEVPVVNIAPPVAATKPSQPPLHKVLLVAAIGTFVFAVLWLIAPWVSSAMRSSERGTTHAQSPPVALPRSSSAPSSPTDMASLRKVAERGDPAAQFALGARYATGEEVKQDYTEAVRWFTLAAEQGHILAQATLGAYYWAGRGVPQDLTKAYYWSVLAQAGGDQASKYRVAVLTSRMSRGQVIAAQQQADDWLRNFAGHAPSTP